ncbi:MAG: ABC transporter ATP-binding protein [Lachnospiraceae bacterium]|nr:ABC transporter ATP-binding protein [Lachnospiraceae bacterium]
MVRIRNLRKSYGSYQALRGLTMEIPRGELFGFVGPNGAGKTTTMKIIAGLMRADSGEVVVADRMLSGKTGQIREMVGYVPDFFGVYDDLKVQEYLEFFASLYGMDGKEARRRTAELLEMLGMTQLRDEMVDGMSRGMKQKLCVARALVNTPELLILDEPASGMEPRYRRQLKELLQELCAEGMTILISSHNLNELAEMCTSIGVISKGRMVMQGDVPTLLRRQRETNPYVLQCLSFPEEAIQILKSDPHVKNIASSGTNISFPYDGTEEEAAELLTALVARGAQIVSFYREEGSLEKMFLDMTTVP